MTSNNILELLHDWLQPLQGASCRVSKWSSCLICWNYSQLSIWTFCFQPFPFKVTAETTPLSAFFEGIFLNNESISLALKSLTKKLNFGLIHWGTSLLLDFLSACKTQINDWSSLCWQPLCAGSLASRKEFFNLSTLASSPTSISLIFSKLDTQTLPPTAIICDWGNTINAATSVTKSFFLIFTAASIAWATALMTQRNHDQGLTGPKGQ